MGRFEFSAYSLAVVPHAFCIRFCDYYFVFARGRLSCRKLLGAMAAVDYLYAVCFKNSCPGTYSNAITDLGILSEGESVLYPVLMLLVLFM